MRISQQIKNMLKHLPVLAVLAATMLGLFAGTNLYLTSLDYHAETNKPQLMPIPEAVDSCRFSNIYTSLPPKCRMPDGRFIPVPGISPYSFVPPKGK
jgi:hypothetical protein